MKENFGNELKKIREEKFPGESLRRVAMRLKLGDGFYSSLSRIENNEFLPSEETLRNILKLYDANKQQYEKVFALYMLERLNTSAGKKELDAAISFLREIKHKK